MTSGPAVRDVVETQRTPGIISVVVDTHPSRAGKTPVSAITAEGDTSMARLIFYYAIPEYGSFISGHDPITEAQVRRWDNNSDTGKCARTQSHSTWLTDHRQDCVGHGLTISDSMAH